MISFTVTIYLSVTGGILVDYTGNHSFWSGVVEQEGHVTVDGTVTRASKR